MKDNLLGKKFGRLTVIAEAPTRRTSGGQHKTVWECRCDCGKVVTPDAATLKRGNTRSCGCLAHDQTVLRNTKHGKTRTKEYRAWAHAKGRCHDKNDPRFRIYGAKGIVMCNKWRGSFAEFFADMGRAPAGFTLERKNRLGSYEPGNCIWADRITQANNTSANVFVSVAGESMTLAECARFYGVPYKSLHHFHRTRGLPLTHAIEKAVGM